MKFVLEFNFSKSDLAGINLISSILEIYKWQHENINKAAKNIKTSMKLMLFL